MSSESERLGEKGDRAGEHGARRSAGTTVNSAVEHVGRETRGGWTGTVRRGVNMRGRKVMGGEYGVCVRGRRVSEYGAGGSAGACGCVGDSSSNSYVMHNFPPSSHAVLIHCKLQSQFPSNVQYTLYVLITIRRNYWQVNTAIAVSSKFLVEP